MAFTNASIVCRHANPEDYHRQEVERGDQKWVVSSGMLRQFAACPSRWKAGYESPESKAKRYGSLFDCLLLTPDQFEKRYAVTPETYPADGMRCPKCGTVTTSARCRSCGVARERVTIDKPWNSNSEHCEDWAEEQEAAGKIVVRKHEVEDSMMAISRLLSDPTIQAWHDASDTQVWVAADWKDEATGIVIPCRCLIDYVPREDTEFAKSAGDLKSTRCASPRMFNRYAWQMGYHIQAAFDLDMLNAATNGKRDTWCFILQENFSPWEPNRAIYGPMDDFTENPGFLELGRMEQSGGYEWLLAYYASCLKSGKWPGYNSGNNTAQGWCVLYPDMNMAGSRAPFEIETEEEIPL